MNYLVLAAAADKLTDVDQIEGWGQAVERYGLGVILAGFVAAVLFFLIRNMIKSHGKNMENMMSLIQTRDVTLDNHLDHVDQSLERLAQAVALSTEAQKSSIDRLVAAQATEHKEHRALVDRLATEHRHSTEIIKEILDTRLSQLADKRNT